METKTRFMAVCGLSYSADTSEAGKTGIRALSVPADSFFSPAYKQRTLIKSTRNLKN